MTKQTAWEKDGTHVPDKDEITQMNEYMYVWRPIEVENPSRPLPFRHVVSVPKPLEYIGKNGTHGPDKDGISHMNEHMEVWHAD